MLSIIICSINTSLLDNLKTNIKNTIGKSEYELIIINNNISKLSIAKAYNQGAESAKFTNLLFIHEDIIFKTQDWGNILIDNLKKNNCGLIGVAGSNYLPYAPIGFANPNTKYNFHYLLQHKNDKIINQLKVDKLTPVITLDGVFLSMRKKTFENNKFDEDILGFHGYDLSISIRTSTTKQNYVLNNIIVEHLSHGTMSKRYVINNILVKNKHYFKIDKLDHENEYDSFRAFIYLMKKYDFSKFEIVKYALKFCSREKLGNKNFIKGLFHSIF